MVTAAGGRPLHRDGLAAHPRAGRGGRRPGRLPGRVRRHLQPAGRPRATACRPPGTAAHAFTLLHDDERAAFRAQVAALGPGTTLLVDTYDVTQGVRDRGGGGRPGAGRGPHRLRRPADAGRTQVRELLDELGAHETRIVVTSDLDEYAIAALAAAPVDGYGVGTVAGHRLRRAHRRAGLQAGGPEAPTGVGRSPRRRWASAPSAVASRPSAGTTPTGTAIAEAGRPSRADRARRRTTAPCSSVRWSSAGEVVGLRETLARRSAARHRDAARPSFRPGRSAVREVDAGDPDRES